MMFRFNAKRCALIVTVAGGGIQPLRMRRR